MNIPHLLNDRDAGFLKITFARIYGDSLEALLSRMGFEVGSAELTPIDAVEARSALSKLFSRDLAYDAPVMDANVARQYADELISEYASLGGKILTNARWEGDRLSGWLPVTKATFNVLVLIVNSDFAVSVLLEDED